MPKGVRRSIDEQIAALVEKKQQQMSKQVPALQAKRDSIETRLTDLEDRRETLTKNYTESLAKINKRINELQDRCSQVITALEGFAAETID